MTSRLRYASVLLFAFAFVPFHAYAATMSVVAAPSVTVGNIVTAQILINSEGVSINNAEATLSFPTDTLQVLSVSKTPSIFSLWITDPTFSNVNGTVSFNGGVPNPGFNGTAGTAITVTFQAKKAGTATLSLGNASIRANDGLGTEVLRTATGAMLAISGPAPTAPAPTPAIAPTPTPAPASANAGPSISSPTNPDETAWYTDPTPKLIWTLPSGTDAVQTVVDARADAAPVVLYSPAITEKTLDTLADGTWYFGVRARTASGWSATSRYTLHIDTTPPTISGLSISYDSSRSGLIVNANVADSGSGVGSSTIAVDGASNVPVAIDALAAGYFFPYQTSGTHTLVFTVADKAGNIASSSATLTIPEAAAAPSWWRGIFAQTTDAILLLIALCSIASLLVTAYLWTRVKKHMRRPEESVVEIAQESRRTLVLFGRDLQRRIRSIERARTRDGLTEDDAARLDRMREQLEKLEDEVVKRLKKLDLG